MFKFVIVLAIGTHCCVSYGLGGNGGGAGLGSIIPAAVRTIWRLDVRPVQLQQDPIQPQTIEVPALELPVKILYHSKSSGVFVQQVHQPGEPGQTEATRTEEEPHKLKHEVIRPVIQELRELIVPYRRVVQEIAPVIEEVQTIVARGEGRQSSGQGAGGGGVLPTLTGGSTGLGGGIVLSGGLGSALGGGKRPGSIGINVSGHGGGYSAKSLDAASSSGAKASASRKA